MHRSGTSCLAGMLAAGGLASAGETVRNWDNARGHHEMLDVVRLNEAVLAHSGGHWLQPVSEVRWTDEHATARDRILTARIEGRPALLKDPRTLLTLSFWRASAVPFFSIGIVRHPLAVARSLESWRGMPLAEGIALCTAHLRALAADQAAHGYPLIDFERPKHVVVAAVVRAIGSYGLTVDVAPLAAAYEEALVHHDDGDVPDHIDLGEGVAVYRALMGRAYDARIVSTDEDDSNDLIVRPSGAFPRAALAAFDLHLRDGNAADALTTARAALVAIPDAMAVLVPLVVSAIRHKAYATARALLEDPVCPIDAGLVDLLRAKVLLAEGDAVAAVTHLERACAVPEPFYQARHLLPQALRAAGRHADARTTLLAVSGDALYPHGPLATLAEWSWLDGERDRALDEIARAIDVAPPHRRGRLRTRRAEWLISHGDDRHEARIELESAIAEDPGYTRSRDVLARIT
ncbi:MAG TPA: hypothetical protein VGM90_13345 [Kofleriaceae bacterium]|jgi:hypothetical protein